MKYILKEPIIEDDKVTLVAEKFSGEKISIEYSGDKEFQATELVFEMFDTLIRKVQQ